MLWSGKGSVWDGESLKAQRWKRSVGWAWITRVSMGLIAVPCDAKWHRSRVDGIRRLSWAARLNSIVWGWRPMNDAIWANGVLESSSRNECSFEKCIKDTQLTGWCSLSTKIMERCWSVAEVILSLFPGGELRPWRVSDSVRTAGRSCISARGAVVDSATTTISRRLQWQTSLKNVLGMMKAEHWSSVMEVKGKVGFVRTGDKIVARCRGPGLMNIVLNNAIYQRDSWWIWTTLTGDTLFL